MKKLFLVLTSIVGIYVALYMVSFTWHPAAERYDRLMWDHGWWAVDDYLFYAFLGGLYYLLFALGGYYNLVVRPRVYGKTLVESRGPGKKGRS